MKNYRKITYTVFQGRRAHVVFPVNFYCLYSLALHFFFPWPYLLWLLSFLLYSQSSNAPLHISLRIWGPFHLCSKSIWGRNKLTLVILNDSVVRAGISSDWFWLAYIFDILQFSNFPEGQRAHGRWWVSPVWSNTSSTLLFKKLTVPSRALWETRGICHRFLWQGAWLTLYPYRPSREPKGQGSRKKGQGFLINKHINAQTPRAKNYSLSTQE